MHSKKTIFGWGLYPQMEGTILAPTNLQGLKNALKRKGAMTPQGQCRAYGDAALGQCIISSKKLDKILFWDANTGVVECESGVVLETIIEQCLPDGYFLPVTPGTKFISIGGAVASDIHGKNHHIHGTFGQYVQSMKIVTDTGDLVDCSPTDNSVLFYDTLGGMGLTGFIYSVKLSMMSVPSAYIKQEIIIKDSWRGLLKAMQENDGATYSVAWVDIRRNGRGILFLGEHATVSELSENQQNNRWSLGGQHKIVVPKWWSGIFINNLSIGLFNAFYYRLHKIKKKTNVVHFDPYFYPLDKLHQWHYLYGKKGFIQYQFVVGFDKAEGCMDAFLKVLKDHNQYSFVTVLKQFGKKHPQAYNSFPRKGITLAVDLKYSHKTPALVKALDRVILAYEGQVYRAKDALSTKALMPLKINKISEKFVSKQSERLS